MTSESKDITAEVAKAAELLSAGLPTEVAKAADVEKATPPAFLNKDDDKEDDDKKKDAEKAMNADEMEKAVEAACEKAVEKALAPLLTLLQGVTKSLDIVDGKVNASLAHQSASTAVLVSLKDLTSEGVQVSKASAVVVEQIADQPAGRKTVDLGEVQKSVQQERLDIDMDKLRDLSKSLETYEWVTLKKQVEKGDYSGLNAKQRTAIKGGK